MIMSQHHKQGARENKYDLELVTCVTEAETVKSFFYMHNILMPYDSL